MLKPGRADLLDGIRDTGSAPVFGRHMDTRDRRAWNRVDALNRSFQQAIVATSNEVAVAARAPGRSAHSGSRPTDASKRAA